jgi:hypothetical protein
VAEGPSLDIHGGEVFCCIVLVCTCDSSSCKVNTRSFRLSKAEDYLIEDSVEDLDIESWNVLAASYLEIPTICVTQITGPWGAP